MKRVMRLRFVPRHYHRELHLKLRKLTQGTRSVEDYYQELEVLLMRANIIEDKEATMSRYLGGLDRDIQDIVEMQHYNELEDMLHKAVLVEQQVKRKSSSCHGLEFRKSSYQRESQPVFTPQIEAKPTSVIQEKSKGRADGSSSTRTRDLKWYKCHGFGHYASECVNRTVMIFKENGEVESEDEPESEAVQDTEEYEAKPVCGSFWCLEKLLMIKVRK